MSGWIEELIGGVVPAEGQVAIRNGCTIKTVGGLPRDCAIVRDDQAQTQEMFSFKWSKEETYASESIKNVQIAWVNNRYGNRNLLSYLGDIGPRLPVVLDAGCGAGLSAEVLFDKQFGSIRYVGSDISDAVDIAARKIGAHGTESFFLQGDLSKLPFGEGKFDIVVSEGVLHHTPSTREAILSLTRLIRPGGIFAFYVYAKKAPIREFTDDYIRSQIANMAPKRAWEALEPLTKLGIALGELKTEIEIEEDIDLLGIKKGKVDIQRLFYWAICKSYFRPEFSFEEMNHINFDWFTPKYCHRQSPAEVSGWCSEAGLAVEHLQTEEAGITVVARLVAA